MKKIIIIGANEFQYKIIEKANNLGYETHVFAWEEGAIAKEISSFFYPISIVEKEKILEKAKLIKPDAICTIATDLAMPTVNYIAKNLNLVGNTLESTEFTTNKFKMRERLSKEGLPCPWYKLIFEFNELDQKILKFPLIVKPIDRSGSRGINKVLTIEELKEAIKLAKEVSFVDKVLVEEYIEGKEYSVETISQNGIHQILQITEKFTTGSPNFIEIGHLQPARITKEIKNKIKEIIKKSLTVLEFKNGASHSEIKINNNEIKIIEIGGRMGGDFIGSDMVELSTGIDFLNLTLDVSLGNRIDEGISNIEKNSSIVRFIFTKKDLEQYQEIVTKFPKTVIKVQENKIFNNNVTDSSNRNGYYILKVKSKKELNKILEIGGFDDQF